MVDYQLLYKVSFYMAAAVLCVAMQIFMIAGRNLSKTSTKVYILMLADVTISSIGGIIYKIIQPIAVGHEDLRNFMLFFQFLDFFAHTALSGLFFLYVSLVNGSFEAKSKKRKILFMMPLILSLLMVIINPITGWIYFFDEKYEFHRNWGEIISYFVAVFYFIAAMINIFIYWYAVTKRRRLGLINCFGLTIAGILLQLFSINLTVELFFESLALTLLMLVVEMEDDRIDQTSRAYNKNAFYTDIANLIRLQRNFFLIYINIINYDFVYKFNDFSEERLSKAIVSTFKEMYQGNNIYRLENQTFAIIFQNENEKSVRRYSVNIHETLKKEFFYKNTELNLKSLVICADIPNQIDTLEDIMMLVECGTYEKSNNVLYGEKTDEYIKNISLEKAVNTALEDKSFEVYYQPIYNMRDKSIYGAEARLCLNDPDFGVVDMGDTGHIMQRNGIDIILGNLLLDEVFMFLGSGIPTELGLLEISIELSVKQYVHSGFIDRIRGLCEKYKVLPSYLNFEVSEPESDDLHRRLNPVLKELKDMGFIISLEGYGTGYSNIHSISSLGFDVINIDAQIMGDGCVSEVGEAILKNSLHMLRSLHIQTLIKDGITKEQIELIENMEVDYLQSDYYSKIVSQNELISILRLTEMARMDEQKARAGSEAKSNFLANMSHEIRTPINAILGMNEMILRESTDEEVLTFAQNIESASRGLLALVNDILDFSKIEAGNMEIIEVEYQLSTLINDATNMVSAKIESKKLSFEIKVDELLPECLYGDEMRIRQVMVNILNNAAKYTNEGFVRLEVGGTFPAEDMVELEIKVSDSGIGIKDEDKDKLFKNFQRLDMQRNKTIEGTGLGLAITYNLVSLMSGKIEVESEYTKGSVFTVFIPQKITDMKPIGSLDDKSKKNKGEINKYRESFKAGDAKILVVDDTPMNITVVKNLLKQTDIMIDSALSGSEALKLVAKIPYDVIFLDYRMPEMDGVTTLKIMREMSDHPNMDTPIILLTANALSGAREKFLSAGFDDYMTKPIDGAKLEDMLLRYLPEEKIVISDKSEDGKNGKEAEDETEVETGDDFISVLKEKTQIDVEKGLENCGSPQDYRTILDIYRDSVEGYADEIKRYYDEKDYENYTIKVHSLKSNSRIIGALFISERAWELEQAGDNRDIAFIETHTESLLEDYKALGKLLNELFSEEAENKTKEDIDDDMLREAFSSLKEYLELMDYDGACFILNELKTYNLSDDMLESVKNITDAVEMLDWDEAYNLSMKVRLS